MRICCSPTSTWSRYGDPQGAALALVPSPSCAGPCPILGQAPDRWYLSLQVQGLELRLCHAQKMLRTHEEMQEKMKEVRFVVVPHSHPCCDCSNTKPSSQTLSLTLLLSPGPVSRP